MIQRLLALFILVPLLDLAVLVWLGGVLGFWPTIALVVVTGTVGAFLARSQGTRVVRAIRTEMSVGQIPSGRLLDGLMVLVGGVLLLTPGLLTDVVGFLLLVPGSRERLRAVVRRRMERMVRSGAANVFVVRGKPLD